MNRIAILLAAAVMSFGTFSVLADCGGCGKGSAHKHENCTKCGEEKGGEKCCKEGATKCEACGLNKASPGCKEKCAKKE